ncbi:TetR/AcrR family transcriptional regulator [Shimia sp. R9_3]|uniref:TetR/AcrR family transcriptional regulator n=1 Tax=Shimia sp. R9_3 TaxID=2821113 RepID=UPI001FFE1CE3|nr:TetR/AcrR family transcriptional regulator [Shimia sp. R9_3]
MSPTSPPISRSKSEILDAAAHVFMTLGADAASIDDVARHLGATKGRIYHHFPSKGALLGEVCLRAAAFAHEAVAPVIDAPLPPEEKLRQMILAHVPAVLGTLPYHKVIIQSYLGIMQKSTTAQERALFDGIRAERAAYQDLFRTVIAEGMEAGRFKQQNLSIALQSLLLLVNAPVFWYQPRADEPEEFIPDLAAQLADMAIASLT